MQELNIKNKESSLALLNTNENQNKMLKIYKTNNSSSTKTIIKKNDFFEEKKNIYVKTSIQTDPIIQMEDSSPSKKLNNRIFDSKKIQFKFSLLRKIKPRLSNQKKKKVLSKYKLLNKLSKIRTKESLINFFIFLSESWKDFIKCYLQKYFIIHIFIRPLKDPIPLMRERQFIYDSIDNPENFLSNLKFSTNIIKNFCKGIVNFVILFHDDLIKYNIFPKE